MSIFFPRRWSMGLLLIFSTATFSAPLNVINFGAYTDGRTLSTRAIQSAIDSCAAAGGGVVQFSAGVYLSGTLYLKDHVHLHLSAGATLLGSTDLSDYPLNQCRFVSYSDKYVARALIWGEELKDVGISGDGVIDGQGAKFLGFKPAPAEWRQEIAGFDSTRYVPQPGYIDRPYLIRLVSCRNVKIRDVTLRNSPMWMQQYLNCDFVSIENISVYNHGNKNNDMIDIDGCRNVVIHGCYGDSDDDGITLKSTAPTPTENVVISDCIVSSFCNAIKMGTESLGGFKNIAISNCIVRPSSEPAQIYGRREGLAGIALEIVDGGVMDGITISNIAITGTTAPIFIRLGDRGRVPRPGAEKPPAGELKNVIISNVVAKEAGAVGCAISGVPGHNIENVKLSNIRINFVGGIDSSFIDNAVPEHIAKYPECTMFDLLPAYGFYCRHVKGLSLRDVTLDYQQPDHRAALVCDDVQDLRLNNFKAAVAPAPATIILAHVNDALITGCMPTAAKAFINLKTNCNGVTMLANDFSRVSHAVCVSDSSSVKNIRTDFQPGER